MINQLSFFKRWVWGMCFTLRSFFENFSFTYENIKMITFHEVWTAKWLTWYLELNWRFKMITVFKLPFYWKSIFSSCFQIEVYFIICNEKLKDALLPSWQKLQYNREQNMSKKDHFSTPLHWHLLKMGKQ